MQRGGLTGLFMHFALFSVLGGQHGGVRGMVRVYFALDGCLWEQGTINFQTNALGWRSFGTMFHDSRNQVFCEEKVDVDVCN